MMAANLSPESGLDCSNVGCLTADAAGRSMGDGVY
jgi:hypothetical protein